MIYPRIYNVAADLVDRHVAGERAAKPAFIDANGTLSYAELAAESARMARLLESLGVRREARVALLLHDTTDFPIAFWGCVKAGIVPVPLNTLLSAEQYAYMLADSRAHVLVVSSALLHVVQPILGQLPALTHLIVSGGEAPPYGFALATELAKQSAANYTLAETCADEVAFWLYSSGSTGAPKGVRHVHTSLIETARLYGQGVLGIRESDVVFSAAKLFFAYGLGNAMTFPLSVGATSVLLTERPTPDAVYAALARHQPTIFFGVPTLYAAMLAAGAGRERSLRHLRLCVSAGEALPAEVGRTFEARFGVEVLDGVGSTEMLHIYVSNRPGEVRYGTSGRPVPGYEIELVDEHGKPAGVGEIGEMIVSGPTAADGYWNQRSKSRATFEGGRMRTGDKYTSDAEGYYTYQGRTDDMFKVSGIWVSPFEVESALVAHDAVLEAAVVPAEDSDGLLKPKAFVVLKDGKRGDPALVGALQEFVKAKAGPWKYPRWIDIVDSLPKTATGKIQRFKLRQ